jgi:hygromycin-B 7''-O-kinase
VGVLPPAATNEAFRAVCRTLGVDAAGLARYPAGSRPVYESGDLVLKLFPPVAGWPDHRIEAALLPVLAGRLPAATPRVHAAGEQDGWGYLLMNRLAGLPLDTVWDRLPAGDRDRLARDLGETIAALHEVPPPEIAGWWPGDWPAFVARQRAHVVGEQLGLGLPTTWADQIPGFLDDVGLPTRAPVLLHTEVMREHLLVRQDAGGAWRLSGLIDFEPAMRGDREYEWAAVGVFVAEGDGAFLGRTLTAYGYPRDQLDRALRRRLLAWLLLHRYSNLTWYLDRLPGPDRPALDALAESWFATELRLRVQQATITARRSATLASLVRSAGSLVRILSPGAANRTTVASIGSPVSAAPSRTPAFRPAC